LIKPAKNKGFGVVISHLEGVKISLGSQLVRFFKTSLPIASKNV